MTREFTPWCDNNINQCIETDEHYHNLQYTCTMKEHCCLVGSQVTLRGYFPGGRLRVYSYPAFPDRFSLSSATPVSREATKYCTVSRSLQDVGPPVSVCQEYYAMRNCSSSVYFIYPTNISVMGHVNVQSCHQVTFQHQSISLQNS